MDDQSAAPRLSGPIDPNLRVAVTRHPPDGRTPTSFAWDGASWRTADDSERLGDIASPTPVARSAASHRGLDRPALSRATEILLGTIVAAVAVLMLSQWSGLITVRSVLTGSMEPAIPVGSVVVALSDSIRTPRPGDVVLYEGRRFDGSPVGTFAHRIVGGSAMEGWIVQGDANPFPDTQRAYSTDIAAVVVGSAPGLGRLASARILILVVLLAIGTWLLVSGLWSR